MKKGSSKSGLTGIILCVVAIIILKSIAPMLGKLVSTLLNIAVLGVLVFCGLVVYYAIKDAGKEGAKPAARQQDPQVSRLLSEGRSALARLRTANLRIQDPVIKQKSENICSIADRIMNALRRNPGKTSDAVQLLKYYLPQLADIVTKYTAVQQGADAAATAAQLGVHLDTIAGAMEKQYSAIVSDEKLDVAAEMEAMKLALQLDGLDPDYAKLYKDEAEELAEKYGEAQKPAPYVGSEDEPQ